jgi:hypothetical protein
MQILDHLQIDNPKSGGDKEFTLSISSLIPPVKTLTYSGKTNSIKRRSRDFIRGRSLQNGMPIMNMVFDGS